MSARETPVTEPRSCRSCSAPILWVKWERSGKSMPVDARPNPSGEIILTLRGGRMGTLFAEKLRRGDQVEPGRNRYSSHFETCPNAKQHRNGG